MPSSDEAQRLRDIVENIDNALSYVGARSHAVFATDQMRVDAVERCIERMAEAMIKIGEAQMAQITPDIPLPALRQLGNILRHEYGEVDIRLIYTIVVERMPILRAACERALSALKG